MLQKQQSKAILESQNILVNGSVNNIKKAVDSLYSDISVDSNKKVELYNNLMVVLCSNKNIQPTINISDN